MLGRWSVLSQDSFAALREPTIRSSLRCRNPRRRREGGRTMTTLTKTVALHEVGPVEISFEDAGAGQPFLLLHGGGGPDTMTRFGRLFAESHPAQVLVPTHPAFGATTRPEKLDTFRRLAMLYVALLDALDLRDVTVVGNSIGGWITAEMALIESPRISGIVLLDAVGIEVAD